jgi:TetR/AcrR family transcriptional regulator, transcriptional repressor of bet genes
MTPAPKRTRIEDIRRSELIAAAHRVFMVHGLGGMTTARICREAGMSPGILAYYFKGKEDVLFAMVRMNNRLLMEDVVVRLTTARSRWERLLAIVEGNFPVAVYEPNVANAWLSVVAASSSDPRYAKLQQLFYRRLRSNLGSVFTGILSADQFDRVARVISTMIDGLWLQKAANEAPDRDRVVGLVLTTVSALLSDEARLRLQST